MTETANDTCLYVKTPNTAVIKQPVEDAHTANCCIKLLWLEGTTKMTLKNSGLQLAQVTQSCHHKKKSSNWFAKVKVIKKNKAKIIYTFEKNTKHIPLC